MPQKKGSAVYLSETDPALLRNALPGWEGLAEAMLENAPDSQIPNTLYVLHDWFLANRNKGNEQIVKYFDQPKEELDTAASLFVKCRDELCKPKNLKPGEHPLLQFYLMYDCLIHAGALKRRVRGIGYLNKKPRKAAYMDADTFLEKGRNGYIYNYVVVDGDLRIGNKLLYHSELAAGRPIEAGGETALKKGPDGEIVSIYINDFSGHYRVRDCATKMATHIDDACNGAAMRPNVYLTREPLCTYFN
ncbi:MAG: hypothetical protein PHE27_08115 [Alphaproteobacteria bacterium]|nr:hypothetical protein [Alphaproteobacteria bacterium]